MKRLGAVVATLAVAILLAAPSAAATDDAMRHAGNVLFAAEDDITVPAGDHVDTVIVVAGTATIEGEANTVVVIDGHAILGGSVESLVAVGSPVDLLAGSIIRGDIMKVDSLVTRHGDAQLLGEQRDIAVELASVGFFLGPLFILLFVGFALAAIAAALLLAGIAARQVREAEAFISRQPGTTFVVGLAATFAPIFVIGFLFVTVVGAPLALGMLFGLWPLAAFVGYLVAAIWVGDWLLRRLAARPVEREHPYLAAVIGVLILQVLAVWPFLTAIASLYGMGAVVRLAWNAIRGGGEQRPSVAVAAPLPAPG